MEFSPPPLSSSTALPRVDLLDGLDCRGKAEQPRWHTALTEKNRAMPNLNLGKVEKNIGPCRDHNTNVS